MKIAPAVNQGARVEEGFATPIIPLEHPPHSLSSQFTTSPRHTRAVEHLVFHQNAVHVARKPLESLNSTKRPPLRRKGSNFPFSDKSMIRLERTLANADPFHSTAFKLPGLTFQGFQTFRVNLTRWVQRQVTAGNLQGCVIGFEFPLHAHLFAVGMSTAFPALLESYLAKILEPLGIHTPPLTFFERFSPGERVGAGRYMRKFPSTGKAYQHAVPPGFEGMGCSFNIVGKMTQNIPSTITVQQISDTLESMGLTAIQAQHHAPQALESIVAAISAHHTAARAVHGRSVSFLERPTHQHSVWVSGGAEVGFQALTSALESIVAAVVKEFDAVRVSPPEDSNSLHVHLAVNFWATPRPCSVGFGSARPTPPPPSSE